MLDAEFHTCHYSHPLTVIIVKQVQHKIANRLNSFILFSRIWLRRGLEFHGGVGLEVFVFDYIRFQLHNLHDI